MRMCPRGREIHTLLVLLVVAVSLGHGQAAMAQVTAKALIGKAVSDDTQYQEINNAIERFGNRDVDGCRAILERARNNNPKLPPPGVMMTTLWLSANQLPAARAELEETAIKFPSDPEPYLLLGDLAFQERRITDAAVLFDRASELAAAFTENPKRKRDFEIRCNAGTAAVAAARRQWESAQKHLLAWLALDPDNAGAHFRMGGILFHLGKESEALDQFKEARKLDAKAAQPELALAGLYGEERKLDLAKRWIEAAIKAAPKDPEVLLASAQWYLGQNDLKMAQGVADQALAIDPKSLGGKIVRGVIARVARDYATAEKFFNEAHVQSPGNFDASNSLALVLIESPDKDDKQRALEMAEANLARYRENSPQKVNAVTTLAWIYYKLDRRDDAGKLLEEVARNNALTPDGAYYIAQLLADRGDKDKARSFLEELLTKEAVFATRSDAVDLLAKLKAKE